jgi:sphingomyelin phosphodiesterase
MHISDLHPDLFYTPGAPVDCGEPLCCRSNVTAKGNSTRKASYWGSIGSCDVPIQTFELLLKDIKRINPDAIIWTGDNTAHDIWQQSQSYNLNFTVILSERLKKTTNSTIIPSMGNHESWPVNVYDYNSDR